MKKFYICIVAALWACTAFAQNGRVKQLFNEGWYFHKGEVPQGEKAAFDHSSWRALELPHDWSVEGPFSNQWASGTGYLPAGIGWYRKTFDIAPELQAKHLFLYFDGVYKNSEVWINGHSLGKRPNGHIPFQYEITPYLNKGGKNTIAVRVDHSKVADSRWYNGSGIYRNVYLIAKEPVHISQWGVAFATPEVSAAQAKATAAVKLENKSAAAAQVLVKGQLLNQQGQAVAEAQKTVSLGAGKATEAGLEFQVRDPQLWSPQNPNLYQLKVSLAVNNQTTDELLQNVGFRTFRFDASEGFFLNGQNMKIKGVCIHQDAGALGSAVPQEVWERRLQSLKALGCNAIRMSHYPHQDYLYDLCDKMGFLVQDEAFDEWEVGKNKWIEGWNVGTPGKDGAFEHFTEWAARDLRDMILRNRNHPSIIMWSIGNEIDYPNDPYTHPVLDEGRNPQIYGKGYVPGNPPASRLGEIAEMLVKEAKKWDTTRPVTAALAGVAMSNHTSYPDALDIVGYNYQEYRYEEDHRKYPNRIIYGSENGDALEAWLAVENNPYISSQFIWTAFDFLGEARSWPSRSSGAGILDMAGFPKPDYYFRQSLWASEPMIYIGTSEIPKEEERRGRNPAPHWNWPTGEQVRVSSYTNCEEAELFLNGKSLGRKKLSDATGRVIQWDVAYQPGTLLVKGYNAGKEVSTHALKTAGEPYAIKVVADKKQLNAANKELAQLEVMVVDKEGNPVYAADNEIIVAVEGPAKLLGLESGSLTSHEDYRSNKRKAQHGKLLAYVQSQHKPGKVNISFQSSGLKPQEVSLTVD
ncbi:sugar-binding domain-containing protein [Cesiribacter sp. SM1]|uniref:sugar-binding domain-containing protein n=1 Tax=Cesiribacter sp. SM1 TaxID=2861196 RepID=UPI001CD8008A|nr:sugar-binding domain-containing protein [Cesiribacter sp. SM1]